LTDYQLTVAELTELTGLAQSRISSHLSRMRRHGLLDEDRRGSATLQRLRTPLPDLSRHLLNVLRAEIDSDIAGQDREAAQALVARRAQRQGWAAGVAGEMEKHYSPGRGWEVITHTLLPFLQLGDVLDIAAGDGVVAQLLAARCTRMTCVELDDTVARAGARRIAAIANALYVRADMHALPLADQQFDTVLLLNALTYSPAPAQVIREAARVVRPGGRVVLTTLDAHDHPASVALYDHCNQGFQRTELAALLSAHDLQLDPSSTARITETRPPFHGVHVVAAYRVAKTGARDPAAR
ncbi:MAG: methyltransferase domain-containing protein, partial [Oceanococcaceae bacterium]